VIALCLWGLLLCFPPWGVTLSSGGQILKAEFVGHAFFLAPPNLKTDIDPSSPNATAVMWIRRFARQAFISKPVLFEEWTVNAPKQVQWTTLAIDSLLILILTVVVLLTSGSPPAVRTDQEQPAE
jgi:hypothetical protein